MKVKERKPWLCLAVGSGARHHVQLARNEGSGETDGLTLKEYFEKISKSRLLCGTQKKSSSIQSLIAFSSIFTTPSPSYAHEQRH